MPLFTSQTIMRPAWQQIADIERAAQAGDGKRSLAGGGRGLSPFGSLAHPLGPRLPGEPVGSDE
ncbi:MAG: hypothetical protein J2P36_30920, partial [Ktedonobacteraceae bacterium]|nr:hypothetical protein [Ktedonobacteraceae bacterium]